MKTVRNLHPITETVAARRDDTRRYVELIAKEVRGEHLTAMEQLEKQEIGRIMDERETMDQQLEEAMKAAPKEPPLTEAEVDEHFRLHGLKHGSPHQL